MSDSFFSPDFFPFHVGIAFVFGSVFGSFFNVCIYRIPMGVPLSLPPSHCYQCGEPIRWYHNIPLLSYWFLRGKCGYCGAPFSMRYFLIELFTAFMFVGAFARYCNPESNYSPGFIPAIIFLSMLLIATFTDFDHWMIPDRISMGGAALGVVLAAIYPLGLAQHNPLSEPMLFFEVPRRVLPLANSVSGAAAGFFMLWFTGFMGAIIFRKEAMGWGDIKLAAMLGAFVGPINILFVFLLACLFGSFAGIFSLVLGKLASGAPMAAAVASLPADAARCENHIREHDLSGAESLVVTRALTSPGAVGTIRHHLPFGPWLSLAGAILYLGWEPIRDLFSEFILYQG